MREREEARGKLFLLSLSLFFSPAAAAALRLAMSSQRVWRMRRLLIAWPLLPSSLSLSLASGLLSPSGSPKKRVPVSRLVPAEATTTKSLSRNSFGTKTKIKEICFGARQKMLSHRFYTLTNSSCCLCCCCCYSCSLCCPC